MDLIICSQGNVRKKPKKNNCIKHTRATSCSKFEKLSSEDDMFFTSLNNQL